MRGRYHEERVRELVDCFKIWHKERVPGVRAFQSVYDRYALESTSHEWRPTYIQSWNNRLQMALPVTAWCSCYFNLWLHFTVDGTHKFFFLNNLRLTDIYSLNFSGSLKVCFVSFYRGTVLIRVFSARQRWTCFTCKHFNGADVWSNTSITISECYFGCNIWSYTKLTCLSCTVLLSLRLISFIVMEDPLKGSSSCPRQVCICLSCLYSCLFLSVFYFRQFPLISEIKIVEVLEVSYLFCF